MQSYLQDYKQK